MGPSRRGREGRKGGGGDRGEIAAGGWWQCGGERARGGDRRRPEEAGGGRRRSAGPGAPVPHQVVWQVPHRRKRRKMWPPFREATAETSERVNPLSLWPGLVGRGGVKKLFL